MFFKKTIISVFILSFSFFLCLQSCFAFDYEIIDLGHFDDPTFPDSDFRRSQALGINDNGEVVGFDILVNGGELGFVWQEGRLQALPMPAAADINNKRQVVGEVLFDLKTKTKTSLQNIFSYAINDAGQIVGIKDSYPCLWENGNITVLDETWGEARDINEKGVIVGESSGEAFIWDNGDFSIINNVNKAFGINDAGQVVGQAHGRPCLWENGQIEFLDELGVLGEAYDINNSGQIVGRCHNKAFFWEDGKIVYLNDFLDYDSGWWDLREAYAINNKGQIVGWGQYEYSTRRAFLLNPIPEPSTILLFLSGIFGLKILMT
ncbi:MAG: hypothetical protein ABII88_04065 [Candidatus Omnitrophota bacterium]